MKRNAVLSGLAVLASFLAGWLLRLPAFDARPAAPTLRLVHAEPRWSTHACVPPDADEVARFGLALQVLDAFGASPGDLRDGAERLLAYGLYRHDGRRSVPVCPPAGLYRQVAEIMHRHGLWTRERQLGRAEYGLALASRIGPGRPEIVDALADIAFATTPQPARLMPGDDIRPRARTVLAGFGNDIAPLGERAFAQLSADDALGTGAAQMAAAAGHPGALPRIAALMSQLLASVPDQQAIPRDKRDRLYELAYAIHFAGEAGREYLDPILALMRRRVQSWAPPFGMVELSPKRMCLVLDRMVGADPTRFHAFPFCRDESYPYEQ